MAGELPVRKNIRLKHYDYKQNGYYFVTICTDFKQPLLTYSKIKNIVVAELALLKEQFSGLEIDCSVIMPNHVHIIFILKDSDKTLSQIVQAFKSITTIKAKQALPLQIGKRLWQPNYFEHIIRNENALAKIREYIQNNPDVLKIKFEEFYKM